MTLVVQDLITSLPSFRSPNSPRAAQSLKVILDKAELALQIDLQKTPSVLDQSRPYLRLAAILVIDKEAPSALELMRFYHLQLSMKSTLQKLEADDLARVFWRRSESITAFDKQVASENSHTQNAALRNMALGQSAVFFEVYTPSTAALSAVDDVASI